ncbi:MAG TPA: hypothetical protein ENI42_07285 [Thermoplasmatales archaeon]|nr:hypothetical protein [Thermoplasmatales archaeon]
MISEEKTNKHLILLKGFAKFILPITVGVGTLTALGLSLDNETWMKLWPLLTAYFFPPLGKESVIPAAIAVGINPLLIALSIAFIDSIVSLFVVWNYDLTKKIPLIGGFIKKVEELGRKGSKRYRWIKPLRFIGIVLFVMVPFQGSGGLVGSILGRLIGMKPWATWAAVTTGAFTGCLLIAYFANILKSILIKNFILGLTLLIVLLIAFILYRVAKTGNNQKNNPKRK